MSETHEKDLESEVRLLSDKIQELQEEAAIHRRDRADAQRELHKLIVERNELQEQIRKYQDWMVKFLEGWPDHLD